MPNRLRRVEALAESLGQSTDQTYKMLQDKGIATINGLYDQALLDAVFAEPTMRQKQRFDWGLSTRLGIGAAKHLLDAQGIRISIHDCKRTQFLMLSKDDVKHYVRWQYANYAAPKSASCSFSFHGFLEDESYEYIFLTCFDGPFGWALTRTTLIKAWEALQAKKEFTGFYIPKGKTKHKTGSLLAHLSTDASKYELKSPKQLGFPA